MKPPPDAPMDDDELADFGAWLRADLATVVTDPVRGAETRRRAHAELRRASTPPLLRARHQLLRLAETSSALAVGASWVVWTLSQLWRKP